MDKSGHLESQEQAVIQLLGALAHNWTFISADKARQQLDTFDKAELTSFVFRLIEAQKPTQYITIKGMLEWDFNDTFARLSELLNSSNEVTRLNICDAISDYTHPLIIPYITNCLHDSSGQVGMTAALRLCVMGDKSCIPNLEKIKDDNYKDASDCTVGAVAQEAIRAILWRTDGIERNSVSPIVLLRLLRHGGETPTLQLRNPATILRALGTEAVLSTLKVLLQNIDSQICCIAAEAIIRLIGKEGTDFIVPLLQDHDSVVRWCATGLIYDVGLKYGGDPALLPVLQNIVMHDDDPDVRCNAVAAIGEHEDSSHIPFLTRIEESDKGTTPLGHTVSFSAKRAIERIKEREDPDFVPTLWRRLSNQ